MGSSAVSFFFPFSFSHREQSGGRQPAKGLLHWTSSFHYTFSFVNAATKGVKTIVMGLFFYSPAMLPSAGHQLWPNGLCVCVCVCVRTWGCVVCSRSYCRQLSVCWLTLAYNKPSRNAVTNALREHVYLSFCKSKLVWMWWIKQAEPKWTKAPCCIRIFIYLFIYTPYTALGLTIKEANINLTYLYTGRHS